MKDLTHELQNIKSPSYNQFEKVFVTVLDNYVSLKKQLKFNLSTFLMKVLQKTITMRSRLKNI